MNKLYLYTMSLTILGSQYSSHGSWSNTHCVSSNSADIVIVRVKLSQLYGGVHDSEAELATSFNLSGIDSVLAYNAILLAKDWWAPEQLEGARRGG